MKNSLYFYLFCLFAPPVWAFFSFSTTIRVYDCVTVFAARAVHASSNLFLCCFGAPPNKLKQFHLLYILPTACGVIPQAPTRSNHVVLFVGFFSAAARARACVYVCFVYVYVEYVLYTYVCMCQSVSSM